MNGGLKMFIRRLASFLKRKAGVHYQLSYAQCGEDIILRYLFDMLKVAHPTYLDIGAHHPEYLSNTYLFYLQGSRGVNVDADPELLEKFITSRNKDVNLNVGVGTEEGELAFHIMSSKTLNTFSADEAARYESEFGVIINKVIPVKVMTFQQLIDRYFSSRAPDFVSLDVEGLDFEILQSIDFEKCRPTVFCVETITYSKGGSNEAGDLRAAEIDHWMFDHGYFKYANTYINTIYVDKTAWESMAPKK